MATAIPVCGSREGYSPDPHDTKEAAIESLEKIETVDRSATLQQAMAEADKARREPPAPVRSVSFIEGFLAFVGL